MDTAFGAFGYVNFELSSYWIATVKNDGGFSNFQNGEPNGDGIYVHVPRYPIYPYDWNDVNELCRFLTIRHYFYLSSNKQ